MAANPLIFEATGVWLSRQRYEEAETAYQQYLAGGRPACVDSPKVSPQKAEKRAPAGSSLVSEMSSMRSKISDVLNTSSPPSRKSPAMDCIGDKVQALEKDNQDLRKVTHELRALVQSLEQRIVVLEGGSAGPVVQAPVPPPAQDEPEDDDDDDIDLFGSDDDDPEAKAEAERIKEERLKQYQEKKSKKPALIAKSNLILDVKPWDDETDMKELEGCVRSVEIDGLLWGASKLVAVGYGIQKLQISCVIEDEKVFTDDIENKITAFEDYIQSMDIVAFNKV